MFYDNSQSISDNSQSIRDVARKENYDELKEFCSKHRANYKISKWYPAYEHMLEMERKIKEQEKQIQEYQSIFNMIGKFIPKQSSIHDIIG